MSEPLNFQFFFRNTLARLHLLLLVVGPSLKCNHLSLLDLVVRKKGDPNVFLPYSSICPVHTVTVTYHRPKVHLPAKNLSFSIYAFTRRSVSLSVPPIADFIRLEQKFWREQEDYCSVCVSVFWFANGEINQKVIEKNERQRKAGLIGYGSNW